VTDTTLYVLHFTFCAEWINISYPISSTRGIVRTWGAGHGLPTAVPAIHIIVFVILLSQSAKLCLTFKIIEQILELYYCIRDSRYWWGNLRERDHLKDPGVDARIIFMMDIQEDECRCLDWLELAPDRDRCRAVVNVVMNIRVP